MATMSVHSRSNASIASTSLCGVLAGKEKGALFLLTFPLLEGVKRRPKLE